MLIVMGRSEFRKVIAIALACFIVSHLRRRQAGQRWLKWTEKQSNKDESASGRLVDHPFIPFLLENAYLFFAPILIRKTGTIDSKRPLATFLTFMAHNSMTVLGAIYFQKFCAEVLYKHVPYFTTTRPSASIKDVAYDYLRCNISVDFWMALLQTFIVTRYNISQTLKEREKTPFFVFPFLGKLLFGRFVVDIAFYLVHRWLHTDFGYKMIHSRHHEHTAPRLQTNFHFMPIDLFLEAAFPLMVTAFTANACGISLSPIEQDVLGHYYVYFEIASHTGKELPVVTWFPPLSPIVDIVTKFDERLVEYHTRHHQLFNCNYSISPWPDMIMGSYQMEYKVKDTEKDGKTQ